MLSIIIDHVQLPSLGIINHYKSLLLSFIAPRLDEDCGSIKKFEGCTPVTRREPMGHTECDAAHVDPLEIVQHEIPGLHETCSHDFAPL